MCRKKKKQKDPEVRVYTPKKDKPWWFKFMCLIAGIFIRKPKFKYLGGPIEDGSVILSNHIGAAAPLSMELYFEQPFEFWGTHEMTGSLKGVYQYLSYTFFHKAYSLNLVVSKIFCLIAAPVVWLFYRGLNIISTYRDHRFRHSIRESVETLKQKRSLVIFPEDSEEGYKDTLDKFYAGFVLLGKTCLKMGIDLPIVVTYLSYAKNIYVVDTPILYSELIKKYETEEKITEVLCARANELRFAV